MDKREAYTKAKIVNDISSDYHLTHAVLACDRMLGDEFREQGKKEINRVNHDLQEAYRKNNSAEIQRLLKEKDTLKITKYHVFVDYIDMGDPEAGRVVKADDKLIISLPKKLPEDAKNADGSFNKNNVNKLRRIMAHELGHIALHVKELVCLNSLQGSKELKGKPENEADWFAEELLRLRDERNKKLISA